MTVSGNLVQKRLLCSLDVGKELLLKISDLGGIDLVQESPDTAVNDGDLILDGHGHVLTLLRSSVSLTPLLSSCWVAAS